MALAVLSNKRDDFCKSMVAHFFPGIKFAEVCGMLPGVAQKPDPAPALAIAKKLAIAPENFLFLGDTDVDMQTAVAARMFAGAAAWGFRSVAELQAAGARKIFDHPCDVITFLS